MNKAVFLGFEAKTDWQELYLDDDLTADFKTWDDLGENGIVDYDIVVLHLEESQIDLLHFIRMKFQSKPVVIVAFLLEKDIDAIGDFLMAGADIAEELPTHEDAVALIMAQALDMLHVGNFKHDTMSNALTETTEEVFTTMVQMKVELLEIHHEELMFPDDDLAVMMQVEGKMKGVILLTLSYEFGAQIISRILSIEPELLSHPDIEEGILEIINMIAGGAKSRISDFDQTYTLTTPKALDNRNKHDDIDKRGTVLLFKSDTDHRFSVYYHFQ